MLSPAPAIAKVRSVLAAAGAKLLPLAGPLRRILNMRAAEEPPPQTLRQRILAVLKSAAAIDAAAFGLMAIAALLFADRDASEPNVRMRFDRSATVTSGQGETARVASAGDETAALFAERSAYGPLPRIAPDGRLPAKEFARAAKPTNGRPVISILVTGLGLNEAATREAIERLPPEVTLAFSPYSEALTGLTGLARARGREYVLEIPTEPFDYPESDPGPLVLLVDAAPVANIERLQHALARAVGYFGILATGGSRFATVESAIAPIAAEAKARGLAFLDDGKSPVSKVGRAGRQSGAIAGVVDRRLDARPTDEGLALALMELERLAIERGHAIGATELYPVAVNRLADWAARLAAKGLVLVPVSVQILPTEPGPGTTKDEHGQHPS